MKEKELLKRKAYSACKLCKQKEPKTGQASLTQTGVDLKTVICPHPVSGWSRGFGAHTPTPLTCIGTGAHVCKQHAPPTTPTTRKRNKPRTRGGGEGGCISAHSTAQPRECTDRVKRDPPPSHSQNTTLHNNERKQKKTSFAALFHLQASNVFSASSAFINLTKAAMPSHRHAGGYFYFAAPPLNWRPIISQRQRCLLGHTLQSRRLLFLLAPHQLSHRQRCLSNWRGGTSKSAPPISHRQRCLRHTGGYFYLARPPP